MATKPTDVHAHDMPLDTLDHCTETLGFVIRCLDGGGSVTVFAAGPYDDPDKARATREQLHEADRARNLHCAEYRTCE